MKKLKKIIVLVMACVMLFGATLSVNAAECTHDIKCVYHDSDNHLYYCTKRCGYELLKPHVIISGKPCIFCNY